jgi:hypothetical protein
MAAATITITNSGQTSTANNITAADTPKDVLHRVTKVYFAKKKVTIVDDKQQLEFIKIDSNNPQRDNANTVLNYDAPLGKEVYLIIETKNLQTFKIDVALKPMDNTLTGNTNALRVLNFNGQAYVETDLITTTVGNYDALKNRDNSHAHFDNLNTDFADYAIIKLQFRPNARATFDLWATTLANNIANVTVTVDRNDKAPFIQGSTITTETAGTKTFLSNATDGFFRIKNIGFFITHHLENDYNFYPEVNGVRKKVGRVINSITEHVVYFYYDKLDNEFNICNAVINVTKEKATGSKSTTQPRHQTIVSDQNVTEGQTRRRIKYSNDDIAEYGSNAGRSFWVLYVSTGNDIQLVRMPNSLGITRNDLIINYSFSATERRYTNPAAMAAFIGALAQCRYTDVVTTGSCFREASCFPSQEHVNGRSIDTIYLNDTKEQVFITAMFNYGFGRQITGSSKIRFTNATRERASSTLHNSHLHSGFIESSVFIINL